MVFMLRLPTLCSASGSFAAYLCRSKLPPEHVTGRLTDWIFAARIACTVPYTAQTWSEAVHRPSPSFLRVGMKTTGVLASCVIILFCVTRNGSEDTLGASCVGARDPSEEQSSIAQSYVWPRWVYIQSTRQYRAILTSVSASMTRWSS